VVVIVVLAVARSTPICTSFSFAFGDRQDYRESGAMDGRRVARISLPIVN
jgi:hypothetical protein